MHMTFTFSWRIFILSILFFQKIYLIFMEPIYANHVITLITLSFALTVRKLNITNVMMSKHSLCTFTWTDFFFHFVNKVHLIQGNSRFI